MQLAIYLRVLVITNHHTSSVANNYITIKQKKNSFINDLQARGLNHLKVNFEWIIGLGYYNLTSP